jgi:nicotinamide mononucleotide transporter
MNVDLQSTLELLQQQLVHADTIQWIVLVFGVTEVWLAKSNNILLYPTGIIAITGSIYSLFMAQLYAECTLNLYYLIMSIYGWWYWTNKKNGPRVSVGFASRYEWIITAIIVCGGWLILYSVLRHFTESTVPAWDAWISATGFAGMWLLTRRKIENWILLNISNVFAVPLLFQKELPLFAVLTIMLFFVACKGYYDWTKIYQRKHIAFIKCND